MTRPTHIALAYDGACYLIPAVVSTPRAMDALLSALDPFQNAQNAWRRSLTALSDSTEGK